MSSPYQTPATPAADAPADPDAYLMPPGYVAALGPDGQVVAVPVQLVPDPATPAAFAAAPDAPQVPADPTGPADAAGAGAGGLPPVIAQVVVLGSITVLAAGGAAWMLGAGLHAAAPAMHDAVQVLKWAAVFVALVVAAVTAVKVRTRKAGGGPTTVALVHRTHTTTISKQTGGFWKGSITNNN